MDTGTQGDLINNCSTDLSSAAVAFVCNFLGEENFRHLIEVQSAYNMLTISDCLTFILQEFEQKKMTSIDVDELRLCEDRSGKNREDENEETSKVHRDDFHTTIKVEPTEEDIPVSTEATSDKVIDRVIALSKEAAIHAQPENPQNEQMLRTYSNQQPVIHLHTPNTCKLGLPPTKIWLGQVVKSAASSSASNSAVVMVQPQPPSQKLIPTTLKEQEYKCIITCCKATFQTADELAVHQNHCLELHQKTMELATSKTQHTCGTCHKTFTTKQHLKVHQRLHSEHSLFKCDSCGKGFAQKQTLQRHVVLAHREGKPFTCSR